MIDEIPVRDPLPKKRSNSFSLGHLAILLGLIFATLIVLLLCSKGFDLIASKIWPQPKATVLLSRTEPSSENQKSTIEIPVASSVPAQVQPTPTPDALSSAESQARSSEASSVIPIPSVPLAEATSPSLPAAPSVFDTLVPPVEHPESPKEQIGQAPIVSSPPIANEEPVEKKIIGVIRRKPKTLAKVTIPGSHLSIEKGNQPSKANHFTLQIIAMHDQKKLQKFIEKSHLNNQVKIYQSEFQGKPWYVAAYGDFKSRDEACKALSGLPQEVKAQKPWVRSVASLERLSHVGQ